MKFIRDLLSRKPSANSKMVEPLDEVVNDIKSRPQNLAAMQSPSSVQLTVSETPISRPLQHGEKMEQSSAMPDPAISDKARAAHGASISNAGDEILNKINAKVAGDAASGPQGAAPAVNIWDIDGEDAGPAAPAAAPAPNGTPRRRRNKTRLLGFDPSANEGEVVSMFDKAEKVAPKARAKFPVGWVLVVSGPGRGECFALENGMSQIGRGEDQTVQLDFGDNTISRQNHAAIVYDPETHIFMLGHGGKKNIVRLNGTPVISNEKLTTNDEIKIGETKMRFIALCTEEFNWVDSGDGSEESDDVAIA